MSFDSRDNAINSVATIVFILLISAFPPFTYIFLRKYKQKLDEADFKPRFESLYMNVNTGVDKSILLITLYVFRRFVYAANIVFLNGNTVA